MLAEGIQLDVNGNTEHLVNMIASVMDQNPKIKTLFELALFSVEMSKEMNADKNKPDDLQDMLGQLGIHLN
jgi:hypothetical protein